MVIFGYQNIRNPCFFSIDFHENLVVFGDFRDFSALCCVSYRVFLPRRVVLTSAGPMMKWKRLSVPVRIEPWYGSFGLGSSSVRLSSH